MHIRAIKTHKITSKDTDIFAILDRYVQRPRERSVLVVTSKIVAICEGRVVKKNSKDTKDTRDAKEELAKKEADFYLPLPRSKYRILLTIKDSRINFTSGIDESNANGYFVLWPKNPQKSANEIREHIAKKFHMRNFGVVITDTTSLPLRRGQLGIMLAHSGFKALKNYVGKSDIFGRKLKMTKAAIAEALAIAAVLVMGEGKEQTPLAIVEDVPFIEFKERNPTKKELAELHIRLEDDLFEPLLTAVKWRKGKHP